MKSLNQVILKRYLFVGVNRHIRNLCTSKCYLNLEHENTEVTIPTSSIIPKTNSLNIKSGPGLKDFINVNKTDLTKIQTNPEEVPYLNKNLNLWGENRKVLFEIYGCQMNVNDTEVVWAILKNSGFLKTNDIKEADIILVITCAIREGAETKIWHRLKHLSGMKRSRSARKNPLQIGILGCMAERLKTQLLEKEQSVDIVAGPDSYKDLPRLLAITRGGPRAANVLLSLDETYADIMPVRLNEGSTTAFVSIMRGCDNMCSYCIVPFTRGRERSRPMDSIVQEVKQLSENGIKEITLLGQNVNSYRDLSMKSHVVAETNLVQGFKTVYKKKKGGQRFAELLHRVAEEVPEVRIRFTSPHPKDFPDEVLHVIRDHRNICRSLHLPAQSGSSLVLERMRRGYSREAYIELVEHARSTLPGLALSSDFICGFCGETEDDFVETLTLMEQVKYHVAFLFAYSMREKTTAHRRYSDDVPEEEKGRRLRRMVQTYRSGAEHIMKEYCGEEQLVMVEGPSKRSQIDFYGRNDANIKVIFSIAPIPIAKTSNFEFENNVKLLNNVATAVKIPKRDIRPGDFIVVKITDTNSQVLKGIPLYHTTLPEYYSNNLFA